MREKNKVIEVASMLFTKNGFKNTSISHICMEAKAFKDIYIQPITTKKVNLNRNFLQK